ncbi:MAG: GH92 family glycosyl hydrolase [Salinivirgaceae bacterium]|nr:GH92 family glycosyl hydrolase [Salinivirgaceae bacterium]
MKRCFRIVYKIFFIGFVLIACRTETRIQLTNWVDPFIGTGGHGHTYPGATLPFGMVQLSPDTRLTGWDGCSGYHYSDSIIYGFSHTHLSGTGVSDYGDVLIMPFSGKNNLQGGYIDENTKTDKGYGSVFRKETEVAKPGYYKVHLDKDDIDVELTSTERVGFHKYTFANGNDQKVILDLLHRDKVLESSIKISSENEIVGHRISNSWAEEQHVYFVIQFSKKIASKKIYKNDIVEMATSLEGENLKVILTFEKSDDPLLVKVGISAVDIEGARKNIETEVPDWDFENVKQKANDRWEKQLSKIEVKGGSDTDKIKFYTALYHTMVVPNLFMDVDKRYRGTDLKIHTADNFTNYTIFSLWDTYRAAHPLYTLIEREKTLDFINTFLNQYKNGGQLPVWELAGNYTGCMIGYHSIPVIVDAYINGITDFDTELALEAMLASANANKLGLEPYREFGYIPSNLEAESVSKTLEYAYDDWCIAQFAKKIGNDTVYNEFIQRAQNYKNIFDPETGFMRAKYDATFVNPFNPSEVNFHYTEANSWQYSFYAPQDVNGLIELMGGNESFENKLDSLFIVSSETSGRQQVDITGLIGQYAHGNEPSHHMAYLYSFIGKPHKTQEYVNQIKETLYSVNPDGLSGNEDCGQMSAWYVMSAMGFYPLTPASGKYILATPTFKEVTIHLENGKEFNIKASRLSKKNFYVDETYLNGEKYNRLYLSVKDVLNGGAFTFKMSNKLHAERIYTKEELPKENIDTKKITIAPYAVSLSNVFTDTIELELKSPQKEAEIFYYFDNSKVEKFTSPIKITENKSIHFYSEFKGVKSSDVKSSYFKIPKNRTITIKEKYAPQYAANGDKSVIDGITGGNDFRLGAWQGYWGIDFDATINLGKVINIKKLELSCLQDSRSWIFMPNKVEFFISLNGKEFQKVGEAFPKTKVEDYQVKTELLSVDIKNENAKYIRVVAHNQDLVPEWHLGAGNPRWVFVDELFIK